MVWAFTKSNHEFAINSLFRSWLRRTFWQRFWFSVLITIVYFLVASLLIFSTANSGVSPQAAAMGGVGNVRSPFGFLGWFLWFPMLFFVLDAFWDWVGTNGELNSLMAQPEVSLATRADYLGGHPDLPHGRFVLLTLGGTLEAPQLTIFLPGGSGGISFHLPVLDVGKTKETLAKVITTQDGEHSKQQTFEVEYTGEAGRKHLVEFSYFYRGPEEVRSWRNFVVCIQKEADTGKRPYGPWKTLPKGQPISVPSPAPTEQDEPPIPAPISGIAASQVSRLVARREDPSLYQPVAGEQLPVAVEPRARE